MTKEKYDEIITVASEDKLEGILYVATFDPDITATDFLKLTERVDTIKRNARKIGK